MQRSTTSTIVGAPSRLVPAEGARFLRHVEGQESGFLINEHRRPTLTLRRIPLSSQVSMYPLGRDGNFPFTRQPPQHRQAMPCPFLGENGAPEGRDSWLHKVKLNNGGSTEEKTPRRLHLTPATGTHSPFGGGDFRSAVKIENLQALWNLPRERAGALLNPAAF